MIHLLQTSLKLEINMRPCSFQWDVRDSCWMRFLRKLLKRAKLLTHLFSSFSLLLVWITIIMLGSAAAIFIPQRGDHTVRTVEPEDGRVQGSWNCLPVLDFLYLNFLLLCSDYILSLYKPFSEGCSVTCSWMYCKLTEQVLWEPSVFLPRISGKWNTNMHKVLHYFESNGMSLYCFLQLS